MLYDLIYLGQALPHSTTGSALGYFGLFTGLKVIQYLLYALILILWAFGDTLHSHYGADKRLQSDNLQIKWS